MSLDMKQVTLALNINSPISMSNLIIGPIPLTLNSVDSECDS